MKPLPTAGDGGSDPGPPLPVAFILHASCLLHSFAPVGSQHDRACLIVPDEDGALAIGRGRDMVMGGSRSRPPMVSFGVVGWSVLIAWALVQGVAFDARAGGWTPQVRRQPVAEPPASETELELAQSDLREAAGDRIFFAAGSAQIGTRSREALMRQARFLTDRPGVVVVIDGHADEAGSSASVMALSEARAKAVAAMLVEAGVARARISIQGHGTSRRVAECPSPACAAQNRRAVTRIVSAPVRPAPQSFSRAPHLDRPSGLGAGGLVPPRRR